LHGGEVLYDGAARQREPARGTSTWINRWSQPLPWLGDGVSRQVLHKLASFSHFFARPIPHGSCERINQDYG
jgi:hypothetical protein